MASWKNDSNIRSVASLRYIGSCRKENVKKTWHVHTFLVRHLKILYKNYCDYRKSIIFLSWFYAENICCISLFNFKPYLWKKFNEFRANDFWWHFWFHVIGKSEFFEIKFEENWHVHKSRSNWHFFFPSSLDNYDINFFPSTKFFILKGAFASME